MSKVPDVDSSSSLQRFHSLISVTPSLRSSIAHNPIVYINKDNDADPKSSVPERQQIINPKGTDWDSVDYVGHKQEERKSDTNVRHSATELYQRLSEKLQSNTNSLFKILSASSVNDDDDGDEDGNEEYEWNKHEETAEEAEAEECKDNEKQNKDYYDQYGDKDEVESDGGTEESQKMELIERYIANYSNYRYICKKNAFLQDKLYQICFRKGFIDSNHEKKDKVAATKRGKRKISKVLVKPPPEFEGPKVDEGKLEEPKDDEDELEHAGGLTTLEHNNNNNNNTNGHKSSISKENLLLASKLVDDDSMENNKTGSLLGEFKLHNLAENYKKKIRHMWGLENSKLVIGETENVRLNELRSKKDVSDEQCKKFFIQFMKSIAQYSREAFISNTGIHLNSADTDQYIMEMTKLFDKLRQTTLQFYITWHGLHFELNSLEESHEVGVQILEYEQLCAENYTLKEKVEYTEQELEKEKAKISHCIQILAHVKDKEVHIDDTLESANINIKILNKRLKLLTQVMDSVSTSYSTLREEQKDLEEQSKLVENPKLMKDFEKTNYDILTLKQQRTDIFTKVRRNELEKIELSNKIQCIKTQKKALKNMDVKQNSEAKKEATMKKRQKEIKKADEKQKKIDKLLRLLETQTTEPWNIIKDEMIIRDMLYHQPNFCQNVSVQ